MHKSLIAAFYALVAALSISGDWNIAMAGQSLVCSFDQNRATLAGSCRPANTPAGVPIRGSVRGRRVVWKFDIALDRNSPKRTLTYVGRLNQDATEMTGRYSIADRRGRFSATKQ